jgi:hypothetical protein
MCSCYPENCIPGVYPNHPRPSTGKRFRHEPAATAKIESIQSMPSGINTIEVRHSSMHLIGQHAKEIP